MKISDFPRDERLLVGSGDVTQLLSVLLQFRKALGLLYSKALISDFFFKVQFSVSKSSENQRGSKEVAVRRAFLDFNIFFEFSGNIDVKINA